MQGLVKKLNVTLINDETHVRFIPNPASVKYN